jgi:N-acetylmuramoyl-L-alanine amidase
MLKKISVAFSVFATILICTSFRVAPSSPHDQNAPQSQNTLRTIVIDAGHGGRDFGAAGSYSYEKNVTLAIALKLQTTLQAALPDVNIVMTRTTDIFDAPPVKANKANAAKGDLFLCIHCNAAPKIRHSELTGYKTQTYYTGKGSKRRKHTKKVPTYNVWYTPNPAKGTETYIWAAHKNDDKELAMRENESLYIDSTMAEQFEGFDPDSPEKRMYYSLKTQQYFQRSANLALDVEQEFTKVGRISREARQRQVGIWVLQATAMPSILVETGYITNPEEEDYLNSVDGQQEICNAIAQAVAHYKTALETNSFRNIVENTQ